MSDARPPAARILPRKKANFFISLQEYDLPPLRASMGDYEGLGGHLTIAADGLEFETHRINRVTGSFFVPIDDIVSVEDVSIHVSRQIEVTLVTGQRLRFVVWGIPRVIAAIEEARAGARTAGAAPA